MSGQIDEAWLPNIINLLIDHRDKSRVIKGHIAGSGVHGQTGAGTEGTIHEHRPGVNGHGIEKGCTTDAGQIGGTGLIAKGD